MVISTTGLFIVGLGPYTGSQYQKMLNYIGLTIFTRFVKTLLGKIRIKIQANEKKGVSILNKR